MHYRARFEHPQITDEENITYWKWKKALLILYSAVVLVVGGSLISIGSIEPTPNANRQQSYLALAYR